MVNTWTKNNPTVTVDELGKDFDLKLTGFHVPAPKKAESPSETEKQPRKGRNQPAPNQEDVNKQMVNQADPVVVAPPEKVRFDFDCNSVHPKLMPGQPAQNCHKLGSQKLAQKLCA